MFHSRLQVVVVIRSQITTSAPPSSYYGQPMSINCSFVRPRRYLYSDDDDEKTRDAFPSMNLPTLWNTSIYLHRQLMTRTSPALQR